MADIGPAIAAAERSFTRPMPKSPQAQLNFLIRKAHGNTRQLADMLGVSPRQALRYRKGEARLPEDKLHRAVRDRWQPRVRQRARQQMAQNGVVVTITARIGYTAAAGTSDDPRIRTLTQALPPHHVQPLLAAPNETGRRQALAAGLGEMYFRDGGHRAPGLDIALDEIDHVEIAP